MDKKRIGVVADDITGSNDIGVMFAIGGFRAAVISLENGPEKADFDGTDVLIINTGSRLDTAEEAARKSREAADFLVSCGCNMIHSKTCSVFRGNIGATFDTVQDAMGVTCSMVAAGFPRNGRTTLKGVHYVNGVPVGESAFSKDPVTPIHHSRLDELIGRQSDRPCRCFTYDWYDKDEAAQQAHLQALKQDAAYVIFDVRDQADLRTVARLVKDERNLCGASALCEELPAAWGQQSAPCVCPASEKDGLGVLILAGSLTPQTAAQVEHLLALGTPHVTLDPALLLEDASRAAAVAEAAEQAAAIMRRGQDVLVFAARETAGVREASARLGITDIEAGRRISLAFEGIARAVRDITHATRYLVAGGETSDAVSRGLGVRVMRIWQEIEAGVPLMTAPVAGGELRLVLKSGSFGSEEFLAKAAKCLRN